MWFSTPHHPKIKRLNQKEKNQLHHKIEDILSAINIKGKYK